MPRVSLPPVGARQKNASSQAVRKEKKGPAGAGPSRARLALANYFFGPFSPPLPGVSAGFPGSPLPGFSAGLPWSFFDLPFCLFSSDLPFCFSSDFVLHLPSFACLRRSFSAFFSPLTFLVLALTQRVKVAPEHGPTVSPWRRCAFSAFCETRIVTNGFFLECVW